MLRGRASRRAKGGAHNHRNFPFTAGHVMDLCGLIHHLVHDKRGEISEHDIDDWPHAGHRSTHRDARESSLGDRRIQYALRAELVYESRKNLEYCARLGDVLTAHEHTRVATHFFRDRLANGLA